MHTNRYYNTNIYYKLYLVIIAMIEEIVIKITSLNILLWGWNELIALYTMVYIYIYIYTH